MTNIWKTVKKPITILAPMDQVTDTVFRQIVATCGRPTLFFTEFTSVEGLDSKGQKEVERRLQFDLSEKPIIAQIWGKTPEKFKKAAEMVSKMGFDGIDINMGCPDPVICRRGSCGALIQNPALAAEIIQATKEGANGLPVSVKTRIGFNKIITEEWVRFLLEQKIAALTLHLRTVREMSKVAAHWDEMAKAVQARNEVSPETILIGNGDLRSYEDMQDKITRYKIDGVMVGRGIFENIWIFNEKRTPESITSLDRMNLLLRHIDLFLATWGNTKNFAIMRKFVKAYVNGFPGASDFRVQLMETTTPEELITLVKEYIATHSSQTFNTA